MLLQPAPIGNMQEGSSVAVKGGVVETFDHFFILQDNSGRALVDLGPRGDGVDAAAKGENITVQGLCMEEFGPPPPDRGPPPPPGYRPVPRADRERAPRRPGRTSVMSGRQTHIALGMAPLPE
jgi:hypothetical protein